MDDDFDAYKLIVPLADFVARWSIFANADKEKLRTWLCQAAMMDEGELAAVLAFLDALEKAQA